jgi:serine/threonine-protein kinase
MVCGKLPFVGDSMAQLMFKIANEPHPGILSLDPALPPCASAIVDKILHKQPEKRFQTGADFARALRACASYAAKGK